MNKDLEIIKDCSNTEWNGFKFPMGFFIVYHENKLRFGKCNPLTNGVIEWYEFK